MLKIFMLLGVLTCTLIMTPHVKASQYLTENTILIDVGRSIELPYGWKVIRQKSSIIEGNFRRQFLVGGAAIMLEEENAFDIIVDGVEAGRYAMWIHIGGDYGFNISVDGEEVKKGLGRHMMRWLNIGSLDLDSGDVSIRIHNIQEHKGPIDVSLILDAVVLSKDILYSPLVFGDFKVDAGGIVTGAPGQRVEFNGGGSRTPSGYLEHHWIFDDGAEFHGPVVERRFEEEGIYTGRLIVEDIAGNKDELEVVAYIYEQIEYKPGDSFESEIIWRTDPVTGNSVAQLTTLPGFNQGFYYHKNPISPDGKWIVYLNIAKSDPSAISIGDYQYFKVNIETEQTVAITERGGVQGADLHSEWLYLIQHKGGTQWISRYNINTYEREDLYRVPTRVIGNVSVNANGSKVLFFTADPSSSETRRLYALDIETRQARELFTVDIEVEHLQCSPVDPDLYMFIDQRLEFRTTGPEASSLPHLNRLGIGQISTGSWGKLASDSARLNSVGNFAHPWWGPGGKIWSDALWSPMALVRFHLDDEPDGPYPADRMIDDYDWFSFNQRHWQHHYNSTPLLNWIVGDGAHPSAHGMGEPYIQLIHVNYGSNELEFYKLAGNAWDSEERIAGHRGPNVHMLPAMDGVVFQDMTDFEGNLTRPLNVFMVEVPDELNNKMEQ